MSDLSNSGIARPPRAFDVEVRVFFLPADHGGRQRLVLDGYRPQFYDGRGDWDAHHTFPDGGQAPPGRWMRAYLTFLSPDQLAGYLASGQPFLIREGSRTVGFGTVTALLDLEESARRSAALRAGPD